MIQVRWMAETGLGLEHLEMGIGSEIDVSSVVVGNRSGFYGLWYQLLCAADWSVRSVDLRVVGGASLQLTSDGKGIWFDASGTEVPSIQGCIDVDISATPFTNTLPIRRLDLERGERREIRVVYISVPTLAISVVDQAYKCLEPGRKYLYEGLFRNFKAELEVDADGLVKNYPSLFQRII